LIPFFPGLYGGKWGNYLGQDEPGTNGTLMCFCCAIIWLSTDIEFKAGLKWEMGKWAARGWMCLDCFTFIDFW